MKNHHTDIAIIGAGIIGIATAYYLKKISPETSVLLIDASDPMALTSAQSGENYRNWWPHPVMTAFTDHSIDLMEDLARETNNLINMNRRGYVLATRASESDLLMDELVYGYSQLYTSSIRVHDSKSTHHYEKPTSPAWQAAPSGVDVIHDQALIRATFPSYERNIKTIIHIRRAGAISAQQMGQYMLQSFKSAGGRFIQTNVTAIDNAGGFQIHAKHKHNSIKAERIVNAAGPFIQQIAAMVSVELPVFNTLQQKIAFEDTAKAIPRQMPFSIDLDTQRLDWNDEEQQALIESDDHSWLTQELPGAIHCRPDGGDNGTWIKLGWAFNNTSTVANRAPELLSSYPEIVLRGAARLNPALRQYYSHIPRSLHHYGGYYTQTNENWPLIGPMGIEGAFVVGAMSGFGTMASAAAGELCARLMTESEVPYYAAALSPQRYKDNVLMAEIEALSQRGIL